MYPLVSARKGPMSRNSHMTLGWFVIAPLHWQSEQEIGWHLCTVAAINGEWTKSLNNPHTASVAAHASNTNKSQMTTPVKSPHVLKDHNPRAVRHEFFSQVPFTDLKRAHKVHMNFFRAKPLNPKAECTRLKLLF